MENKKIVVAGLSNGKGFAEKLVLHRGFSRLAYSFRRFPDNELFVKFGAPVRGKTVALVQPLAPNPNDAVIELFLAGRTARMLGAKKVVAVTPYLAYMRQDKAFHFGESFSAKEIAFLLSLCADELLAFDPHLHRIKSLSQIFSVPAKSLSAAEQIGGFVAKNFSAKDTVIVGPDMESSQWAKKIADSIGFESTILEKTRLGDRSVRVKLSEKTVLKNRNVVIIDDIVSTGNTVVQAILELKKKKPKAFYCIFVHALLVEGALQKIKRAGAAKVISCNTIESKTNRIDLSGLVAKELLNQ